jgi:hypothetical protein
MWDPENPEEGWYRDPDDEELLRFWDGSAWTNQRLNADGSEFKEARFAINPLGVGIAIAGAAVAILALFLPAAEAPSQFSRVASNSLIQGQTGAAWLIAAALAAAAGAVAAHLQAKRNWVPIVCGAIMLGAAILIGATHSDALTLYPLNPRGVALSGAKPVYANPGIAIYVLGLGGALTLAGGIWIVSSAEIEEEDEPGGEGSTKTCPDCAEAVQRAARICRYCGHRFEESEAERGEAPAAASYRCTICNANFAEESKAIAHADQAHTDLAFEDAKDAIEPTALEAAD